MAINRNVFRECFTAQTLLEPDFEGQGGLGKAEELGQAFQDVIGLEVRVSMASSLNNEISPMRVRQANLWGLQGNEVHKVEPECIEL